MKLAIGIATYQRPDGSTPTYLKRALESVKKQTHQDYKVFLIGDRYEDANEFEQLATSILPKDKIYFENRPVAPERDLYKNNKNLLWRCGGVSAYNYAIDTALDQGYDFMCHLDHDDYWSEHHLSAINFAIENVENLVAVCTGSYHIQNQILPRGIEYDNRIYRYVPQPFNVVHSSICLNHKVLPLRYRDVYAEEQIQKEADADMWIRLNAYLAQHSELSSVAIGSITCFHLDEKH